MDSSLLSERDEDGVWTRLRAPPLTPPLDAVEPKVEDDDDADDKVASPPVGACTTGPGDSHDSSSAASRAALLLLWLPLSKRGKELDALDEGGAFSSLLKNCDSFLASCCSVSDSSTDSTMWRLHLSAPLHTNKRGKCAHLRDAGFEASITARSLSSPRCDRPPSISCVLLALRSKGGGVASALELLLAVVGVASAARTVPVQTESAERALAKCFENSPQKTRLVDHDTQC
jgi:hypothetical protein